jgi:hypothetical protein
MKVPLASNRNSPYSWKLWLSRCREISHTREYAKAEPSMDSTDGGMQIAWKRWQNENVSGPIRRRFEGGENFTSRKQSHREKQRSVRTSREAGRQIDSSAAHSTNAEPRTWRRLEGDSKTTEDKRGQSAKQNSDRISTLLGISMEIRAWQSRKAESPIRVRREPGSKVIFIRDSQLEKHEVHSRRTEEGMQID